MECYSESSELVIHAATWMNLLRIMLGAKKKKKKKANPNNILFFAGVGGGGGGPSLWDLSSPTKD